VYVHDRCVVNINNVILVMKKECSVCRSFSPIRCDRCKTCSEKFTKKEKDEEPAKVKHFYKHGVLLNERYRIYVCSQLEVEVLYF